MKPTVKSRLRSALLGGVLALPAAGTSAAPEVVASIAPLHSLVAAVMQGVGEPRLLLMPGVSEHDHALKPSDAKALGEADAVFWIGDGLETFLAKPLAAARKARTVELIAAEGVATVEPREGGPWQAHDHGHAYGHGAAVDPHIWLDPRNAAAMVGAIAKTLAEIDPANAQTYAANAAATRDKLVQLEAELAAALAPVRDVPYVVFHDAYHYFEARFGLSPVGALASLTPEARPSAKRLKAVRERIVEVKARCVFSEPQYEPALVGTVIEGTQARRGELDPLGATLPPGPEAYFALMRHLAGSLKACLAATTP